MNDNVNPVFKPILDSLTECPSVGKSIGPSGEGRLPGPPSCKTCDDTGRCPCGATDCAENCGRGGKCEDCHCDSCSEAGKKIVGKDGDGGTVCEDCAASLPKPGHCEGYDCAGKLCLCPCWACRRAHQKAREADEIERADVERDRAKDERIS